MIDDERGRTIEFFETVIRRGQVIVDEVKGRVDG